MPGAQAEREALARAAVVAVPLLSGGGTRLKVLHALAMAGRDDPRFLLGVRDLFGDLADRAEFVLELQAALGELYSHGAHATLVRALQHVENQ